MTIVFSKKGAVLAGTRPLVAVRRSNLGGFGVQFRATGPSLKNAVIGTAVFKAGLWGLHWNTTTIPNGTYVVHSVATDAAGQRSVSRGVTATVANDRRAAFFKSPRRSARSKMERYHWTS